MHNQANLFLYLMISFLLLLDSLIYVELMLNECGMRDI